MTDSVKSLISRYDEYTNSLQTHAMPLLRLFCRLWVAWVFLILALSKLPHGIAPCTCSNLSIKFRCYLGNLPPIQAHSQS